MLMMRFVPLLYSLALVLAGAPIQIIQEDAHYQIQHILHRFKNLTTTKAEITLFQTHPEFDTNCIRDSLSQILPECTERSPSELDPQLRAITAAKLSLCEFQVAGVSQPEECHSSDWNQCVMAMERKSQWWTSYSGYYRSIGDICHQESLPYEKDQVLNMFLDVTNHYDHVLEFLRDYTTKTESFKEASDATFEKMIQFMDVMDTRTLEGQLEMQKVWDAIKLKLFEMTEMSMNVTDAIMVQNNEITKTMMGFFEQTSAEFDETLDFMKLRFVEELEMRDQVIMGSMEKTQQYTESLYEITSQSEIQSRKLNRHLKSSALSASSLNSTIKEMDSTAKDIIGDIHYIKELTDGVSSYLQGNPLARVVVYVFGVLNWDLEMGLLFISLTSLCFMIFYCMDAQVFKIIGVLISSIITGCMLLYWFSTLIMGAPMSQATSGNLTNTVQNK